VNRTDEKRRYWLDDPKHVTAVYRALIAVCLVLGAVDLFFVKRGHFAWEGWIGFYAIYGFVCCVALVLVAKQLRKVLMRREDYYDR
jgi:hypothetical protein